MNNWRAQFPYFGGQGPVQAFLDSAASAQKPAVVLGAMAKFAATRYANTHRGVHGLAEAATQDFEAARTAAAQFIGAKAPESVIFTAGTTAGVNLAAYSLWQGGFVPQGAHIVATLLEHHSNFLPWQRLAAQVGGQLHVAPLTLQGELDLGALEKIFKANKISILALTHVSNVTGQVLPVREIVKMAHEHGALVFVDGAQAVAHQALNVEELGADFYAFSAHKLYGPTGIGVLYLRPGLGDKLPPYMVGGGMVHRVGATAGETTWAPLPYRFEAGTPAIIEAIGLHEAIKFVSEIGWNKIISHEKDLIGKLLQALGKVPDLKIYATPRDRIGVVSFNLGEIHPHDVGSILSSQGVAVRVGHHCAQPLMAHWSIAGCVRASLGLYNNEADVDALVAGLMLAHKKLS